MIGKKRIIMANSDVSTDGRWQRFLSYAITEIALVVIGILIAVAINNWNENRKRQNEFKSILAVVQSDLELDVADTKEVEEYYRTYQNFLEQVVSNNFDRTTFEDNPVNAYVIMGFPELSLHRRGFRLLEQFHNQESGVQTELINDLISFYYRSTQEVEADDNFRLFDQKQNLDFWKRTQSWWPDYISSQEIEGFLEYALNNTDYRNRVASYYMIHYRVFLPEMLKYREEAEVQLKRISEFLADAQ